MKKLKSISKITVFSLLLISLFAGCSNLAEEDDSKDGGNKIADALTDSSKGALKIKLGASPARYISAYNFSLSNFSTWSCTFKDENDDDTESFSISTSDSSGTASLSYKDEILTAEKIPAGKYKVTIIGTYTPSSDGDSTSSTYTISGSKSGVEIEQGKTASADIFVGMAKTGKGSLSLTLTDEKQSLSNIYSNLIISLENLNGKTDYSYSSVDKNTFNFLKDSSGTSYTLASTSDNNLESGWYLLSITIYDYNYKINLSNSIIEIADGITTTGTISLSLAAKKTYYATNDTSAGGNGLATLSRINLSTLLGNLAATLPDEGEIDIYVNGTSEIDLDKFASLKSEIADTEKSIYIYNANESTETAAISLVSSKTDDAYTTATNIAGALTLTAGTEKTLDVSTITVEDSAAYTITLKGGAAMNVTTANISGTLEICAVVSTSSTTTDNFGAYTSTPFLTTTSSVSSNIALYEYGSSEASSFYDVNENTSNSTYNYYVISKAGNIVLADGTFVAASNYSSIDENNPPVAVIAGVNDSGNLIGIGLHISDDELTWAASDTTGYKTYFENITSAIKQQNQSYYASSATFEGDNDGSDNWNEICNADTSAYENAKTNYPAFYWANTYGTTYKSYLGNVTSDWYMPSAAELCIIYKNKEAINNALSTINTINSNYAISSIVGNSYWSSTQYKNSLEYFYAFKLLISADSSADRIICYSKSNTCHVLVVHTF